MAQKYRTLRAASSDEGVLGVVIDAPPMNLIGPELAHDLVSLFRELESGQETRVVVLESANPDYFVPHVDLTKVAEYTAEAAKAGGPDDASLGMLWHKLSELPVVTIAKYAAGPAGRAANWRWRATCDSPRGKTPSSGRSRPALARPPAPAPCSTWPGSSAEAGPNPGSHPRRRRLRRRCGRTIRLDQPDRARRRPGRVRSPPRPAHRLVPHRRGTHRQAGTQRADHARRGRDPRRRPPVPPAGRLGTRPRPAPPPSSPRACRPAARSNSTSVTALEPCNRYRGAGCGCPGRTRAPTTEGDPPCVSGRTR